MADYNLGTARGRIVFDTDDKGVKQATDAVKGLGSQAKTTSSTGQKAFSVVQGALNVLGVAAIGAATGVAAIGTAIIKAGLKRSIDIQVATAKMKGLGLSATQVKTAMDNALSAVLGTAYGLGDAADLASVAITAGVKEGAQLEEQLKAATNAAAAMNVPLSESGMIFRKVWTSGKVTMNEINQIQDRGLGIMGALADHYKVSGEEMTKMVSSGKVDMETFTKVINDFAGNVAKEMGQTLPGAMMNFKNAIGRIGEMFTTPAITGAVPLLNSINGALKRLEVILKPIGDSIGKYLTQKMGELAKKIDDLDMSKVVDGFKNAVYAIDEFKGAITALLTAAVLPLLSQIPIIGKALPALGGPIGLAIGAFAGMLASSEDLRKSFGKLFNSSSELLKPIGKIFEAFGTILEVVLKVIGDALAPLIDAILPALGALLKVIAPILKIIGTLFKALSPIITPLIELAFLPLIQILELLTPLLELLGEGLSWLADQIESWASSSEGDIKKVGESFSFLETSREITERVINWIVENWPKIQKVFEDVWNRITEIWNGLVEFFSPIIEGIQDLWNDLAAVAEDVWTTITDAVQGFKDWWEAEIQPFLDDALANFIKGWETLAEVVQPAWDAVMVATDAFKTWWVENVQPFIDKAMDDVGKSFSDMGDDITKTWEDAKKGIGVVVDWFDEHVGPVIDAVAKLIEKSFNWALNEVTRWWTETKAKIDAKLAEIRAGIDRFLAPVVKIVDTYFKPVYDKMIEPINKAIDKFNEIKGRIEDAFRNAGNWLKNAGREIIGGLIKGIEEMLGNLTKTLTNVTNLIPDNKGPIEKDRVLLKPSGESIMEGLIAGIADKIPALLSQLRDITADIPLTVTQSYDPTDMLSAQYIGQFTGTGEPAVQEVTNIFDGDIVVPLEDLEQIKTLEEFLDMLRVYKGQKG